MALPDTKHVVALVKKSLTLEAQGVILKWQEDAQHYQGENIKLKDEIKALKETADLSARVVWERPFYWLTRGGQERDGPYCQKCWDDDKKLIRLQHHGGPDHFICKVCKRDYPVPGKSGGTSGFGTTGEKFEPY